MEGAGPDAMWTPKPCLPKEGVQVMNRHLVWGICCGVPLCIGLSACGGGVISGGRGIAGGWSSGIDGPSLDPLMGESFAGWEEADFGSSEVERGNGILEEEAKGIIEEICSEIAPHAVVKPQTVALAQVGSVGCQTEEFLPVGFDEKGQDWQGFNEQGFRNGLDRQGFNEEGFRNGLDRQGFNEEGFREGFDRQGYDKLGFSEAGLDRRGFDQFGIGDLGLDCRGFDAEGYDHNGYDRRGFNRSGKRRFDPSLRDANGQFFWKGVVLAGNPLDADRGEEASSHLVDTATGGSQPVVGWESCGELIEHESLARIRRKAMSSASRSRRRLRRARGRVGEKENQEVCCKLMTSAQLISGRQLGFGSEHGSGYSTPHASPVASPKPKSRVVLSPRKEHGNSQENLRTPERGGAEFSFSKPSGFYTVPLDTPQGLPSPKNSPSKSSGRSSRYGEENLPLTPTDDASVDGWGWPAMY